MSVYSVTITDDAWRARKPFQSVGLICRCGSAVAMMEGVMTTCAKCNRAYIVTVMVTEAAPEREDVQATGETAA